MAPMACECMCRRPDRSLMPPLHGVQLHLQLRSFFDTAEMYGDGYSEEVTGRALKASGYARDK